MNEIADLKAAVFRIETALAGDPKYGTEGIAGDIKEMKAVQKIQGGEITKIKAKLFKEKVIVGATATAATGTAVWFGKPWLIKIGAFLASLKP